MSNDFAATTSPDEREVSLLTDILTELGGSVSPSALTPPQTQKIDLLTEIRDALAGAGLPAGVLGDGVEAITFLFRPRGEPADAESMSGYVAHGPHVVSFTRDGTHAWAPNLSGPVYEIQLDAAYEPDEVAVFVWSGAFEDVATNIVTPANPTGAWSGADAEPQPFGGLLHLPQVWQTGPNGDKTQRLVIPVTISLDAGGGVTWSGGHSDPLTIMLVFFDRTAADYRNPALP